MSFTILQADSHRIPLAAKSVQCVVTSPPYWGLRDYGTATWVGGDEGCDHRGQIRMSEKTTIGRANGGKGDVILTAPSRHVYSPFLESCGKCGATRIDSQIGLEPTPEEYVAKIVAVFAEVWRVLRDDGVCFVNIGDSYAANGIKQHGGWNGEHDSTYGNRPGIRTQQRLKGASLGGECDLVASGLKPKDLVGIPWRVAFALQAAGWYLRSDIIWSKPNPMPESVTDRPTKSHEYIFLLTKRERYFFDQDAVREALIPHCENNGPKSSRTLSKTTGYVSGDRDDPSRFEPMRSCAAGRNIRTVWEIATQPYPEAHFATFPEEIALRCIKAGTSEKGACAECGAPWERVIEKSTVGDWRSTDRANDIQHGAKGGPNGTMPGYEPPRFIGWQPTCKHDAPTVPCVTLDPFSGAGTVPLVADKLNRRGIGLELKADYCKMAHDRCYDDAPLLAVMEG